MAPTRYYHKSARASGSPFSALGLIILHVLKPVFLTVLMTLWLLCATSFFSTQQFQYITTLIHWFYYFFFCLTLPKTLQRHVLLITCWLFNCCLIPKQWWMSSPGFWICWVICSTCFHVLVVWIILQDGNRGSNYSNYTTLVQQRYGSEQSSVETNKKKIKGITIVSHLCS